MSCTSEHTKWKYKVKKFKVKEFNVKQFQNIWIELMLTLVSLLSDLLTNYCNFKELWHRFE